MIEKYVKQVSQRTHKCQQQPFDTDNFVDDLLETSTMKETQELSSQDEQSIDVQLTSEENQYVLVLNDDGQHVLKRKLDVENTSNQNSLDKNINEQNKEDSDKNSEFTQKIWNHETSNKMEYKDNYSKNNEKTSNDKNNSYLWNKMSKNKSDCQISDHSIVNDMNVKEVDAVFSKNLWSQSTTNEVTFEKTNLQTDSNARNDFFSMVMSPIENEISSPSAEMKHLRLSSPVNNQENSCQTTDCYPLINNHTNAVLVDHNNPEENFNQNNVHLSTLQTINEDSLKELLNSITDK
jgi:hypothetical protein